MFDNWNKIKWALEQRDTTDIAVQKNNQSSHNLGFQATSTFASCFLKFQA